jgi:acyl transferase domain-containing protein
MRASVSNFGWGGTNGHVILEHAPIPAPPANIGTRIDTNENARYSSRVYILSSKDSTVIQAMNKRLAAYIRSSLLTSHNDEDLARGVAYTLGKRKSRFHWATVVKARGLMELADRLDEPGCQTTRAMKSSRIGYVFNGQGAQWYGMGRELLRAYPVFSSAIQQADQILKEHGATWSLHGTYTLC